MSIRCLAVVLLALTASVAGAQEPPRYGEKVDVNLVLLDAIVTDPKGHQILGLGNDDFVVRENGVEQKIDSVEYFTNRTLVTSSEEKAPFKVERVREERSFVFFFDKPSDNQLWDDVASARSAAKKFVAELRPGDRVAVAGHDVRLKIYSDFTSDRKALELAIDDAGRFGPGLKSGTGPIMSALEKSLMLDGSGTVYEALEVLGDALRMPRGRKNLILFSAGIYEQGQEVRSGMIVTQSRYYEPMIEALNASNVAVYAINLFRDGSLEPMFHQTLESLAADTSGDYFRYPVSFPPILKRIEQGTNGYYLISYYSHQPRTTSRFQKVEVALRHPQGLRLRAREGYMLGQ